MWLKLKSWFAAVFCIGLAILIATPCAALAAWVAQADTFVENDDKVTITKEDDWDPETQSEEDNKSSGTATWAELGLQENFENLNGIAKNVAKAGWFTSYSRAKIYCDDTCTVTADSVDGGYITWTKSYKWIGCNIPAKTFFLKAVLYSEYNNDGDCDNDWPSNGIARATSVFKIELTGGPHDISISDSADGDWDIKNDEADCFITVNFGWECSGDVWKVGAGFSVAQSDDADTWDEDDSDSKLVRGTCDNVLAEGPQDTGYCVIDSYSKATAQTWADADYAEGVVEVKPTTFNFSLAFVP